MNGGTHYVLYLHTLPSLATDKEANACVVHFEPQGKQVRVVHHNGFHRMILDSYCPISRAREMYRDLLKRGFVKL